MNNSVFYALSCCPYVIQDPKHWTESFIDYWLLVNEGPGHQWHLSVYPTSDWAKVEWGMVRETT